MATTPRLLADYACHTGEGPLWHPDEDAVYWVDIPAGRLFRYHLPSGEHSQVLETEAIGGFTIQADGRLLLFMARGQVALWDASEGLRPVIESIPAEAGTRFNDVIADPEGRVFGGTMSTAERPGRFYRLDPDGHLEVVLEEVGTPNGMGFTPDLTGMYFTDSRTRRIDRFDYDRGTGALTNRRTFVDLGAEPGVPDGMTVDAEGCVWTGKWDGGCAVCYSPTGEELRRLTFPARKVSCVTFGGSGYRTLFATCAGGDQKATEGDGAGALFAVEVDATGRPEFRSRLGL